MCFIPLPSYTNIHHSQNTNYFTLLIAYLLGVAVDISAAALGEVVAEPWAAPPPQSTEDEAAGVEPRLRPVADWNTPPLAAVGSDWERLDSHIVWAATRTAARIVE